MMGTVLDRYNAVCGGFFLGVGLLVCMRACWLMVAKGGVPKYFSHGSFSRIP